MQIPMYRLALAAVPFCGFALACGQAAVSGRIVDYLARPVEGAQVVLYEETHDFSTDRDIARLRDEITGTDASGRFVFRADIAPSYRVFIVARKEGLALGWDVLMQPADNVIVLEKPCVLGGIVVDAAGRPVGGVKVRAVPKSSYLIRLEQNPILAPEPWLTARTDNHGRFCFEAFAADVSADFWAEAPGWALVYTYTPHRVTVCGFEAGRTDVRLVLPQEVIVRGRVIDVETADPVKNAHVVICPDAIRHDPANPYLPDATVSGEEGRFLFKGVPLGWHYIDISAPYDTGLVDRRVRFEARAGVDAGEVVASLSGGGAIEIEAREEQTDAPIPNLLVYLREAVQNEQSDFYKHAHTGADGSLQIRAPAGLCKFSTRLEGYSPWSYEDQVFVAAGRTAQSTVILRRYPKVSGFVVDGNGRPVAGAAVNHGVTDEAGRFEVPFPSDESPFRRWIVRHEQGNLATIANIERDDKPVRITLRSALAVSGRINDPNGIGIPAARVALHLRTADGMTPYGTEVLTDSQGRYEMAAVVPGGAEFEYRISVNASGYGARQSRRIAIDGEPGTRVELNPIVLLSADQSVTGVVVDAGGNPMAGVPIVARGDNQPTRYSATDSGGRFDVRRVCKGPLRIQAGFSRVREETGILQAEGGDRGVKVVLGRDGVHLRYATLMGKPLPDGENLDSGLLPADAEGRRVLLCFFDMQQRPSRAMIAELARRAERLTGRGVVVLGVQASTMNRAELDRWAMDNHIALPIRMAHADAEQMRRTWGVRSLPWLILTDHAHIVTAEGSQLAEFERRIVHMTGGEK